VTTQGVLDTSVFIASEAGRRLDVSSLPDEVAISVITLAELRAGVLAAKDITTRSLRMQTLDDVADMEVLHVNESVATLWAELRVRLAETGARVNVNDMWIAATAASRGLPVVTQDNDFDSLDGIAGVMVIKV
jgi:predicted nucleic acid-binding protein